MKVDILMVDHFEGWNRNTDSKKTFSLSDLYYNSDLIAITSHYDTFGTGLLEAIYYRKPILINRYPVYIRDLEPKGFELIEIDGFITPESIEKTTRVLNSYELRETMTAKNFDIAKKYYSKKIFKELISKLFDSILI
jgi:glycosyltransferase involved in cell wall biosynthesis